MGPLWKPGINRKSGMNPPFFMEQNMKFGKKIESTKDARSEKIAGNAELDPRFAATVKNMLNTPPKPHKDKRGEAETPPRRL